jgi:apolipoprotein N-acyltransferase
MKPGLSMFHRFFLCFLSGLFVFLSFPNFIEKTLTPPTAFLGWIALIPLFIALHKTTPKQGALLSWFFGFVQFGGILYWIAFLEAAQSLSGLAWFALVFYLSLYFFLFGWIYRILDEKSGWGLWSAPFIWVALEYIRGSRPWGGFSWGEIGYSQAPYPFLLTFTSWASVYGLTFLMVWFNAWLAHWIVITLKDPPENSEKLHLVKWFSFAVPFIVLTVIIISGEFKIKTTQLKKVGSVALLQPSIDQDVKWSKENEIATYNKLQNLVRTVKNFHPSLIIWPETAAPSYLLRSPNDLNRVESIIRESKVSHLVGCLDAPQEKNRETHYYNAAIHFTADGKPEGIYHKCHLVPFGEFVPFQKYLTFLGPVVGDLGNFDFGKEYEKFNVPNFSFSPMICYEVIFPGDVYQAFKTNADALVNISNDAWYGRTASAYQHAMMAVVRAAEERKPLLRASNAGICLATDPFGKILCSTRLFDETTLEADVLLSESTPTLYSRWGNWLPRLCWVVVAFLCFLAHRKTQEVAKQTGSEHFEA